MPSVLLASASVPGAEPLPFADAPANDLADLFMLLAAAFAPPPAAMTTRDWCEPLLADLEDLGRGLAVDTAAARRALQEAASGPLTNDPWLVEYSRLFLVPPVAATLNTGIYLEGGLAGVSSQMMAQCYATGGFSQREDFRDLPDHVAIQLEFIGALLGRHVEGDADGLPMAQEFCRDFVAHWVRPLRSTLTKAADAHPAAVVYAGLADVLLAATDRLLQ